MYKIGDLVKLDATYDPYRHPPMGTVGIVTHIEDWGDVNPSADVEQFVRVHWAGGPNTNEQCYADSRLKMVKEC
jgi:hypothetical protein